MRLWRQLLLWRQTSNDLLWLLVVLRHEHLVLVIPSQSKTDQDEAHAAPRHHEHGLTQLLQGAVATDLRLHGQLVGRRQLRQVVEGMREGGVAAVVSHAPRQDAAAAAAAGTLPAARQQLGPRGELRGVVHTGPSLCKEVSSGSKKSQ